MKFYYELLFPHKVTKSNRYFINLLDFNNLFFSYNLFISLVVVIKALSNDTGPELFHPFKYL